MNTLRTYRNYLPSPKYVRLLRLAAWNALLVISGLLLIGLVGEIYLRMVNPFIDLYIPTRFVEGVGVIREPNAELRYARWQDDNFVVSRTNSLGFLDREPVGAERAAAGCHIAFIGDSNVEAWHVPIADRFHVRLEEMAARQLPHLAIKAQAYGISNTGQINQLPFYDEYARGLNPKLLILLFDRNDFVNNSTALQSLAHGLDPDRQPYMTAQRDAAGTIKLRPPDSEFARFMLSSPTQASYDGAWKRLTRVSYFAKWVDLNKGPVVKVVNPIRFRIVPPIESADEVGAWADMIAAHPCCTLLREGWQPARWDVDSQFTQERLPPVLEEAVEYTAFGIDQFKQRTDRDGVNLAILPISVRMGMRGDPQFDRLSAIAEARHIPIISDYAYIVRQGYDEYDAFLPFDGHYNATGHRWVAEAILEWLKANEWACD